MQIVLNFVSYFLNFFFLHSQTEVILGKERDFFTLLLLTVSSDLQQPVAGNLDNPSLASCWLQGFVTEYPFCTAAR